MGAFESTKDPTAILIAEVNRFGPGAPSSLQYVTTPYPLATGTVPAAVAVAALHIARRRAEDGVIKFADKGSADLLKRLSSAFGDPVGFVTKNIGEITGAVKGYADANGLPASKLSIAGKVADLVGTPLMLAAVGAGLLLFFVTGKKGRR